MLRVLRGRTGDCFGEAALRAAVDAIAALKARSMSAHPQVSFVIIRDLSLVRFIERSERRTLQQFVFIRVYSWLTFADGCG